MANSGDYEQVIDSIKLLLSESQSSDDEMRCALILQTHAFFIEVLNNIKPESPDFPKIIQATCQFIKIATPNLKLFLENDTKAGSLSAIMTYFLHANIASKLAQDLSFFVISFFFNDFSQLSTTKLFSTFFRNFFSNNIFAEAFEASGGLLALWELLMNPAKSYLCGIVFAEITKTIHLYFQSNNVEPAVAFLNHANSKFLSLPETNVILAFQFLYDLIFNSKHKLLGQFIELGGFKSFNIYILKKNDPQLLIVYQMFRPMCTEMAPSAKVHPILAEMISLLLTKNISSEIRIGALTQLFQAIGQFPKNHSPVSAKILFDLGSSIDQNNGESIIMFFKICNAIATKFDYSIKETMPVIPKMCTYKIATEFDISILLEMFKKTCDSFVSISVPFFSSLTESISSDDFKNLIQKYPLMISLLNNCFLDSSVTVGEHLLSLIFKISPSINAKDYILYTLILKTPANIEALIGFLQKCSDASIINSLFKIMIHILVISANHRIIFSNLHFLPMLTNVKAPPGLIFDLIVAMSGRHFNVTLDSEVSEFLNSVNFLKMPVEAIHKLAFSVFQNNPNTNCYLVFPSILSQCGSFTITSPYEMWLCGQYGIDKWMKDTGKTIDQFPCIASIAQRYLLPKHVQSFFEYPKLFAESCSDIFGSIPLFEFPKDLPFTKMNIPIPNDSRAVSVWFFFKEYPPSPQNIVSFNNISFSATGDELYANKKVVCEFPLNRWFHVVITTNDKMNARVFLDAREVYSQQGSAYSVVTIGNEKNPGYWFIGGSIKVFKSNLTQQIVERLFNRGVNTVIKFDENMETVLVTPTNFIGLFGDPKQSEWLSENTRPVLSFSFIFHINHAYRGGTCPLQLIFQRLQEKKIEDCTYLLNALCSLQKVGYSGWAPNVFAVRMSAIFLLCPQLFDINTLTNVLSCFTSDMDDTIMWDSILSFILDFGLFNSEHRSFIISKMFEFVAQFSIDSQISQMLTHFIFHVLELVDCGGSDADNLLALLHKIAPASNHVARLVASLPDFRENFSSPSMVYNCNNRVKIIDENNNDNNDNNNKITCFEGDHLYQSFFDFIIKNNKDFKHFYLVCVLPPLDAFKLIKALIPGKKIPPNERRKMLLFCLTKTDIKECWNVIFSLFTNNVVDLSKGTSILGKVEQEFHPLLIIFLSFIGIHLLNEKDDHFWPNLWSKAMKLCFSIVSDFPELNRGVLFSLDQLLSFGKLSKFLCLFPYAPSLTEAEKVVDFAIQPGQPFPETPGKIDTHPTFKSETSIVAETRKEILSLIPEKRFFLPPNSKQFITSHRDKYTESFIEETIKMNDKVNYEDWFSILPPRKFKVDELEKSAVMRDALKLVASILVNFISKPDVFKSAFVHVMLSNGLMNTKHAIFIMRSLFFEICNLCITKKVFEPFIVNFVCFAIGEGWFRGKTVETFHLLLNLIQKMDSPISRSFGTYLILAFKFVTKSQLPDFLKLFIQFQNVIFTPENMKREQFAFMLFDRLKGIIDEFKEQTVPVCNIFKKSLLPLLSNKEEKLEENSITNFMIIALAKLVEGGVALYNQLVLDEPELEGPFNEKYNEIKAPFDEKLRQNVVANLKKNADRRKQLATLFYQAADEMKVTINNLFIQSLSVASVIRYHEREMLLFDENNFLRMRERLLTPHQYFKVSLTKTKTLSLLSDPVFPTRRLEKSPMLYKIPQFPAGNITDVSPDLPIVEEQLAIWPEFLTDQLGIDFQPYETLMMHSPNQLNLTFSYHFAIDDWLQLEILQNTVNFGEKFQLVENVSLLYGLDPLDGTVLMNEQYIFFVEGLKVTSNGVKFVSTKMPSSLYSFYISYIVSGYFGQCYLFSGHPILQIQKSLIVSCTSHNWLQRPISLEVSFLFGWSFILIADTAQVFQKISDLLKSTVDENYAHFPPISRCPSPINSGRLLKQPLKEITKEWHEGNIDNFSYLCLLNKLGSRSFIDFSQYYVFPWILADYKSSFSPSTATSSPQATTPTSTSVTSQGATNLSVSKLAMRNLSLPMGQIGPDRLERFDAVFEDSGGQYFYGTHYMHLGVVLFYLFRNDPFCLFSIYFHHGYDHPNRVFHDIAEAWNSAAVAHPADVKEIVPQMFCVPEFLTNTSSLPLTSTTDGRPVDNVTLAKWSENPRDFTDKMRSELESERVSQHINEWIDLIFGYKSRGEAAIEAKNVYQPLCYPDKQSKSQQSQNGKLTQFEDEIDEEAAVTCIINFGQCANQLFKNPHSVRNIVANNSNSSNNNNSNIDNGNDVQEKTGKPHIMTEPNNMIFQKVNPKMFAWPINDIAIPPLSSGNGSKIIAASGVSKLLFGSALRYSPQRGALVKSALSSPSSSSAASSSLSGSTTSSSTISTISSSITSTLTSSSGNSSSSNNVTIFETTLSIDFFVFSPDGSIATLFQKEGSFVVLTLKYDKGELTGANMQMRFQTLSNVTSAAVSSVHFVVAAACGETVQRFDLGLQSEVEPIEAGFVVRKVAIDDRAALIIVCGDREIGVWSISGQLLVVKSNATDSPVTALCSSSLNEYAKNRFFITGHANGYVRFWNVDHSIGKNSSLVLLKGLKMFNRAALRLAINEDATRVVVTSWNEMFCLDFLGSDAPNLKKEYADECSFCSEQITQKPKTCANCHRFVCQKCEPPPANSRNLQAVTKMGFLCRQCLEIQAAQMPKTEIMDP